jgi:hypothetical protein
MIAFRPLPKDRNSETGTKFQIDKTVESITIQAYIEVLCGCNGEDRWLEEAWN